MEVIMFKKLFLPIIFGFPLCVPTIKGMEQAVITFEDSFNAFANNIKIKAKQNWLSEKINTMKQKLVRNEESKNGII